MTTIRDARVNRGISQKELARTAGIDARTLRKIENGEHVSDVSQKAVERALGVSAEVAVTQARTSRHSLGFHVKFGLFAVGTLALVSGIFWSSSGGPMFWPKFVATFSLATAFLVSFYWVASRPRPGNTNIVIMTDLASAAGFGDLQEMAEGWLGRSDITVSRVATDQAGLRFTVRGDFDVRDYPALVQKLRGLGLDASVSTAF